MFGALIQTYQYTVGKHDGKRWSGKMIQSYREEEYIDFKKWYLFAFFFHWNMGCGYLLELCHIERVDNTSKYKEYGFLSDVIFSLLSLLYFIGDKHFKIIFSTQKAFVIQNI